MATETHPWLANYPSGIPANIDIERFATLNEFFQNVVKTYGDHPAFSCMGKEVTFNYIDKRSTELAAYLHSRGLEPGDRVAIMMPNLLQYPIAIFGCLKAGVVVVNTNPLYTPREMLHQFKMSGVRGIIIAENFASNLEQIIDQTNIKMTITTSIGELLGTFKGWITDFVVKNVKRMVPKYEIPNTVSFSQAMKAGRKFTIKPFQDGPDRVIIHQYTGGTTGVSKGAMLTNRNLVANCLQIEAVLFQAFNKGKEIILCPLPMYHIFAFTVNTLGVMSMGALSVLVVNARDLSSVCKEFKRYKISMMTGVNTLFNALLNFRGFERLDFGSMKFAVGGGMAVQNSVARKWEQITGNPLIQGYGLTETSPVASINPVDGSGKLGSIGMPVPSTEMRIVDESRQPAEPDEVGEVQVRGPQVMAGYFERPDDTAKVIDSDGWLSTGDMGKMDEQGYFWIVDRKKDMINVSGFNVYPNEIEDFVAEHHKVLEVAAVGIPSDKSGEVVKIFVVKKDKSLTQKELLEYCRSGLTGYKVPKEIEFMKTLPKTNVGKILRRALREEEEAGAEN